MVEAFVEPIDIPAHSAIGELRERVASGEVWNPGAGQWEPGGSGNEILGESIVSGTVTQDGASATAGDAGPFNGNPLYLGGGNFTSGAGDVAAVGATDLYLYGGDAGLSGGDITITGSTGTRGRAGRAQLRGGDVTADVHGPNEASGRAVVSAGRVTVGVQTAEPAKLTASGGFGTADGVIGGDLTGSAGDAAGPTAQAGNLVFAGGSNVANQGGSVQLRAGAGSSDQNHGNIEMISAANEVIMTFTTGDGAGEETQTYYPVFLGEGPDPIAPVESGVRFYARDNGSGKTQLCARFPTGAVQVIATEP